MLHIPAAVSLRLFGGRRAVLRWIPGSSRTPSVALQLADDLWAVRGKRAGQDVGGLLLLPFRGQTAVADIGGLFCWSLEGCEKKNQGISTETRFRLKTVFQLVHNMVQ